MAFKKSTNKATINYEVLANHGKLGTPDKNGFQVELREISWNGREPKYDIRPWGTDEDGNEQMRKGITLTGEECEDLLALLKKIADEDEEEN